ncbi:Hypothetical predicted protein, partial [Marmota monax]
MQWYLEEAVRHPPCTACLSVMDLTLGLLDPLENHEVLHPKSLWFNHCGSRTCALARAAQALDLLWGGGSISAGLGVPGARLQGWLRGGLGQPMECRAPLLLVQRSHWPPRVPSPQANRTSFSPDTLSVVGAHEPFPSTAACDVRTSPRAASCSVGSGQQGTATSPSAGHAALQREGLGELTGAGPLPVFCVRAADRTGSPAGCALGSRAAPQRPACEVCFLIRVADETVEPRRRTIATGWRPRGPSL